LATSYTYQPFKGALQRMESQSSGLQQARIVRAKAAAEKYLGWLSKHLHLVSGRFGA